jgi:glycosyltransferase involved in cell wall biosynthesis
MKREKISVVLPAYNEEGCIEELLQEIEKSVNNPMELVVVDDGSVDRTLEILKNYKITNPQTTKKIVVLSRRFGHQHALMAGLSNTSKESELILVMDSDFQDDPHDIPLLLAKIREGYDCVYAVRKSRKEGLLMNLLFRLFYKIHSKFSSYKIPPNAGSFSIFKRNVLEKILMFAENDIYFPGLRAYVGYNQTGIKLERKRRAYGRSRVGFMGLVDLSVIAFFGSSGLPMRMLFLLGLGIMVFCNITIFILFILEILKVVRIPGFGTLLLMIGLSGIQIMFLGIMGEYVGELFRESKKRPRWLEKEIIVEESSSGKK